MYGSKEVHTPFFKWMSSTAVMFYELDITDLLDSEGSIHAFTVVLGFLKLTASSCGVEPDLHRHLQVIQAIKPRLTGPGHSFRWVLKHDYGNSELIQSSWPYVDPEPIRGRLL
ncbi:hypothetical protein BT96DRAFT_577526 [Gymnopus androsaceus JB14]|uniref:Uncharacterized protein n=1 Tax=Gymnopus androsaceus JB14 TaxID=1447944 RepID=A0A6A4HVC1_9AGAR|nr:hypothetical protein BT96DRAFT_577526 [Gymnopus androsaceus JB14]